MKDTPPPPISPSPSTQPVMHTTPRRSPRFGCPTSPTPLSPILSAQSHSHASPKVTTVHNTPRRSPRFGSPTSSTSPAPLSPILSTQRHSHTSPKVSTVHTTPRRSPRLNVTASPPPISLPRHDSVSSWEGSDKVFSSEINNVLASLHDDLQLDGNPYIASSTFGLTVDDFDGDIDRDSFEREDYNVDDFDDGSDSGIGNGSEDELVDENAVEENVELSEFVKKTGNLFEDEDNEKLGEIEAPKGFEEMVLGMSWPTIKDCRSYFKS
ncbi:hypothetical protein FRX31_030086 [Thalictrum thalictroides]|uniref:Uncharacterized protein n=1 Tax=Thalictrum thalictroides TaxID=46969 RepID=A0A7J6V5G8_THATH|nr:hypothetical protein FRX31_030086 [Thalictrum thalictroides]